MTIKINRQKPRVLHSAALLRPPSGILNQMQWEQEAAQRLEIPWKTVMYCPDNSTQPNHITYFDYRINTEKSGSLLKKTGNWIKLRKNYHHWLNSQIDKYDIFLLRYYVHDPYQWSFVRSFPKPVYFVNHTLEVPELAMSKTSGAFIRSNLEAWIGKYTLAHASGLIAVTDEILKYETQRIAIPPKKSLIYPNGILIGDAPLRDRRAGDIPELLFVANFAPWHGLDILVKHIKNSQEQFILHLVGKTPANIDSLIQGDQKIILHGQKTHSEIINLSEQCWVGLSSFALHRKKMTKACPLKVREYLSAGLPVYGDNDIFPADAAFYRSGRLDVSSIIDYAKETRYMSKDYIANLAKKSIDKESLVCEIYNRLLSDDELKECSPTNL